MLTEHFILNQIGHPNPCLIAYTDLCQQYVNSYRLIRFPFVDNHDYIRCGKESKPFEHNFYTPKHIIAFTKIELSLKNFKNGRFTRFSCNQTDVENYRVLIIWPFIFSLDFLIVWQFFSLNHKFTTNQP